MMIERWSTRTSEPPGFGARWSEWLAHAPLANFSLRLDHARWDAEGGRHAVLVLAEHAGRRMALLLREAGGEFHCGWPWRWQAVMCDEAAGTGPSPTAEEARLLFQAAQTAAESTRLRMHLPIDPGHRVPGYRTGVTILQRIDASDEELFESMDSNKRRLHRRAVREGFTVREAAWPGDRDACLALDREALQLRGEPTAERSEWMPDAEAWRDWQLPWMRLLVAERGGRLEAAVGDGLIEGAVVDGRFAMTTNDARRAGAMALLCQMEARHYRDRGHRWLNHGGDTTFKREIAGALGSRHVMYGWLGGGRRHALGNHAEAFLWRSRPTVAAWVRAAGRALPRTVGRVPTPPPAPGAGAAAVPPPAVSQPSALRRWTTGEALDDLFAREWQRRVGASGLAGFTLRLDWLQAEARAGRPAEALLLDEPDLHAALVLRRLGDRWVCGHDEGAHLVFENAPDTAAGASGEALQRVLGFLRAHAEFHPLEVVLPHVRGGPRGRRAGRTIITSLRTDDLGPGEALQPAIERARAAGFEARLAQSASEWEAFHALLGGDRRRAAASAAQAELDWAPPDSPWQWLFVAVRDGIVHGGAGVAWAPGGAADALVHAHDEACRQAGANVLLAWAALQHAREAGCRRLNWRAATRFEQQFGGELVEFDRITVKASRERGGGPAGPAAS